MHGMAVHFLDWNWISKILCYSCELFSQNVPWWHVWNGSEYAFDSQHARVLNIPWFSISQGSECTRVLNMPPCSEYTRILIIPGFWIPLWFWIFLGSEYERFTQGLEYTWIIPEYAWSSLNMLEYARICMKMPKFAWMAFVLYTIIVIPGLLEHVVTCVNEVYCLK